MFALARRAAGLIAVLGLVLLLGRTAWAEEGKIELKNEMDLGIEAMYCFDAAGTVTPLAGPLPAGESVRLDTGAFQKQCRRLGVLTDEDTGWQFYIETDHAAASLALLSMSRSGGLGDERHPTLLIEDANQLYIYHAGMPFFRLIQLLQFGMDEATWQEATMPNKGDISAPGMYAVYFAGASWSLAEDGIIYKEFIPDMELAAAVTIAAPFSPTRIVNILNELRNAGCTPWLFSSAEGSRWFTVEGKALEQDAEPVGHETVSRRWTDLYKLIASVSDSDEGELRIVVGNDEFHYDLRLDMDNSEAVLHIIRNSALAFG